MTEHVLLKYATVRRYSENIELPEGAEYSYQGGYWRLKESPLVRDKRFVENNSTKKCDQETGEDQKGT